MSYRVPSEQMVPVSYMRERIRDAERFMRKRGNINFVAALAVASMAGWTYAQVTRGMGYPPAITGAIAVLFQIAAGICAWAADLGVWLADQWRKSDMPIHFTQEVRRRSAFWEGFRSGLRTYGPWAIGLAIIAFAAFYTQDELRGIYRDIVDIVTKRAA